MPTHEQGNKKINKQGETSDGYLQKEQNKLIQSACITCLTKQVVHK